MTLGRTLLIGLVVLVVAAVGAAFYVLGPPSEQRLQRLDERRLQDLDTIRAAVNGYWRQSGRLPGSLDEARPGLLAFADPVSGEPYEYRVTGEQTYELCATFDRAYTPEEPQLALRFWPHPAGRHCFALDASGARDGFPGR